jgi:hypothetical protein
MRTWTLVILPLVTFVILASATVSVATSQPPSSGLSPSIPALDCNKAGNPAPSALYINLLEPAKNLSAGGSITMTMEYAVVNYTAADYGVLLYFPTIDFTFPESPRGNYTVTMTLQPTAITGSGWTTGSGTNRTTSPSGGLDFKKDGLSRITTQKVAIMADVPYGNLTLEFRWMWNLTQPNGTTAKSAWTIPKSTYTKNSLVLPSIFFPAQYIQFLSGPGNGQNETIGTEYTAVLGGPVAGKYFFLEMEDGVGTVVQAHGQTIGPNVTTANVTIPILNYDHYLAPGLELVHIHDACGAILYNKLIDAVFAPTVTVTFYLQPGFCGPMTFNGTSFANGTSGTFVPSTTPYAFTAPVCRGYSFSNWFSTGGLHLSSGGHLLVSYNGTFTIVFKPNGYGAEYTVTFKETGLPSGTSWSVTLNGTRHTSTTNTITFTEPNGTYSYAITDISGWHQTTLPYTGTVKVSGAAVTEPTLALTQVTYSITLTESGLPSGTEWWVNLTDGRTFSSTTNSLSFAEPNGSYPYTVATADKEYASPGGSFPVNGAVVSESVTFSLVTYTVTFTESGLPSGTPWYVNLTDGQSYNSTGNTISFTEPNGTYNSTVATTDKEYAPVAASGSFGVRGAPVSQSVTFSRATYTVTFPEAGLPSETTWYVNGTAWGSLSATLAGGLGTSVSANLANGTYYFTVASANKTWASAYTSPFVVNGGPVTVPVTFTQVTYAVTFTESGLPSGTTWYVNITDGQSYGSTGSTITVSEPNGTYDYAVVSANKTWAPVYTSPFVVNGGSVTVPVTFTEVTYAVTFTETGLPLDTLWNVTIGSVTRNSTTSTIILSEPNGSYSYTVTTGDKEYASSGGLFTVLGASVSQAVTFSLVTYRVTFTETGLPTGMLWYLNVTGNPSLPSTSTSVAISLTNGTYSYRIASANKDYAPFSGGGSFQVSGAALPESVTFSSVVYSITFTETGLPSGTSWSATLNGAQHTSTTTATTFSEPNGTYPYTLGTVTGYIAVTNSGAVTVDGAPVSEPVTFTKTTTSIYVVTFMESGLPSGTSWSVTLNGTTHTSTTGAVTFTGANGSYAYSIGVVTGYVPNPSNGTLTVSGAPLSIAVPFEMVYAVTFIETILPSGTNWSVTLTGSASSIILVTPLGSGSATLTRWSNGASTIRFYVSNGTYSYSSWASGYSSNTGSLTVNGQSPPPATVGFTSSSSSSSGLPMLDYVILGIVVVVVAIGLVAVWQRRRGGGPSGPKVPPTQPGLGGPENPPPPPSQSNRVK